MKVLVVTTGLGVLWKSLVVVSSTCSGVILSVSCMVCVVCVGVDCVIVCVVHVCMVCVCVVTVCNSVRCVCMFLYNWMKFNRSSRVLLNYNIQINMLRINI